MIETVIRTEDVPREERFDYWCEAVCPLLLASLLRSDDQDDFRASMRGLDLGTVHVAETEGPSVRLHRSTKLIQQDDPEVHQLWLTVSGAIGISQSGREAVIEEGDMVLYDSSLPFHSSTVGGQGGIAGVVMAVPKALFPVGPDLMSRLTATRLSARSGLGAVVAGYLNELMRQPAGYTPADTVRMGTVTMDLLAAWCAHELEATASVGPETRQHALQARIHRFILDRLGDPGLSPSRVASAHQISLRYLHKLFEGQGATVAEWIRGRRLERCRRDLADPRLGDRPIHSIAARWGYVDAAHFSRAFRTAYGMSPKDYRRAAQV